MSMDLIYYLAFVLLTRLLGGSSQVERGVRVVRPGEEVELVSLTL